MAHSHLETSSPRAPLARGNGGMVSAFGAPDVSGAAHQAFWLLRITFTIAPILFGIDKFFNWSVQWPDYLAGWINNIVPGTAQQMMYGVGAVEILAGILVALKPRYASYVVGAWLLGIVINLFSSGKGFYDIGARDLVLMAAAFALARLAAKWDPPLALERRLHHSSSTPR